MIQLRSWEPNRRLGGALERQLHVVSQHNYLYAEDQKRVVEHLAINCEVIVMMALRSVPSKAIAAGLAVSREAIDRRLRPLGFKNPPGVRGRPRSYQPEVSRSSASAGATELH